ncbi:MAG: hypothetical protein AAGA92_04250 [Planctomycetota bacterium]
MSRPSFSSPHESRPFRNEPSIREGIDRQAHSPRTPSHPGSGGTPEPSRTSPVPRSQRVLSDADLDAFLPEEGELDPYPEPGDFWTGDA